MLSKSSQNLVAGIAWSQSRGVRLRSVTLKNRGDADQVARDWVAASLGLGTAFDRRFVTHEPLVAVFGDPTNFLFSIRGVEVRWAGES